MTNELENQEGEYIIYAPAEIIKEVAEICEELDLKFPDMKDVMQ